MKYNGNREVIIATYADGGVAASVIKPDNATGTRYHYMCAFDNEDHAREFMAKNIDKPVFLRTKMLDELAREFNCSIVWPGLAGIAFIDSNGTVEHVDTDELIKIAFKDIAEPNKSYGSALVVDKKIASVEDIDFSKKHFIVLCKDGGVMIHPTYNQRGKKRDWLVISPNKDLIIQKASDCGIGKKRRKLYQCSLLNFLSDFLPDGQFDGVLSGIMYIDEHGSKLIPSKKIIELLDSREDMIQELCAKTPIYLDANYFVSANKEGYPTTTEMYGIEYMLTSQRMDTMMKAMMVDDMNPKDIIFTNLLTMREILDGFQTDEGGILLCLDDNPDHLAYMMLDEVYDVAIDGRGDEEEIGESLISVDSDNDYMMSERFSMMIGDGYIITTMSSLDGGDDVDAILVGDDEDTLLNGLKTTGYEFGDEVPTARPTYEIFAEFRRGGQLYDCDGMVYFTDEGCCFIPKEAILETLDEWEETTDQKTVRVDMDFDEYHYVARCGNDPIAYMQPNGTGFVVVSKTLKHLEQAIRELFGDIEDAEYNNEEMLGDIAEQALADKKGIAICDAKGITFIEPKRLEQALYEE